MSTMYELLHSMKGDVTERPTDHDLSHLAEWADEQARSVPSRSWKRAYALIREGADLLMRRRAMNRVYIHEVQGAVLVDNCDGTIEEVHHDAQATR